MKATCAATMIGQRHGEVHDLPQPQRHQRHARGTATARRCPDRRSSAATARSSPASRRDCGWPPPPASRRCRPAAPGRPARSSGLSQALTSPPIHTATSMHRQRLEQQVRLAIFARRRRASPARRPGPRRPAAPREATSACARSRGVGSRCRAISHVPIGPPMRPPETMPTIAEATASVAADRHASLLRTAAQTPARSPVRR